MVGVVEDVNQALGGDPDQNGSYEWSFKNKYVLIIDFGSIWVFKKNLVCIFISKRIYIVFRNLPYNRCHHRQTSFCQLSVVHFEHLFLNAGGQ